MKKMVVLILLTVLGKVSVAQLSQNVRISADPMLIKQVSGGNLGFTGNPFLFEEWQDATVVFSDPSFVNMRVDLKYNLLENELLVKNEKGEPGVFREDVKEFYIKHDGKTVLYRKGFNGPGLKKNHFVEVLYDGKVKFIKGTNKDIVESKGYNTGVPEKKIEAVTRYFFVRDGEVKEAKLNEKFVLDYLNTPAANSYVKENKLNLKKETDIASLLRNVIK